MPYSYKDRLVTTVSAVASSGLGAFTISSASSSYQTFGAGDNGLTFEITAIQGTAWEVFEGTYTHSGTSLSRGTLLASSTGSRVTFTAAAVLTATPSASTLLAVDNLLGALGSLGGENTITAAATAIIGRLNVCSGTTADYTVTLPAVSGNAGKYIGFAMAQGLTRFVTLDGNASETIDGAATRIMWAGEVAILRCDGTAWTKVGGKTRPMVCLMSAAANTSVANTTSTTIPVATVVSDNTGRMADTSGSTRMYCRRGGNYLLTAVVRWAAATTAGDASGYYYLNDTTDFLQIYAAATNTNGSAQPSSGTTAPASLATGDFIRLRGYHVSGASRNANAGDSYLALTELPTW